MALLALALTLTLQVQPLPAIDTNAIDNWPSLSITPTISAYGNYVAYAKDAGNHRSLFIRATHGTWKKEIAGATRAYFSADERYAIVPKGDSLSYINLQTEDQRTILAGVSVAGPVEFEFSRNGKWMFFRLSGPPSKAPDPKPGGMRPVIWNGRD